MSDDELNKAAEQHSAESPFLKRAIKRQYEDIDFFIKDLEDAFRAGAAWAKANNEINAR